MEKKEKIKTIKLSNVLPIEDQGQYKIHFMTPGPDNDPAPPYERPLPEVTKSWQEYRGEYNRWKNVNYIFALVQIPNTDDLWVYLGIFEILEKREDGYRTQWPDTHKEFFNRLIIKYHNRSQQVYRNLEGLYDELLVHKINDTAVNKNWSP